MPLDICHGAQHLRQSPSVRLREYRLTPRGFRALIFGIGDTRGPERRRVAHYRLGVALGLMADVELERECPPFCRMCGVALPPGSDLEDRGPCASCSFVGRALAATLAGRAEREQLLRDTLAPLLELPESADPVRTEPSSPVTDPVGALGELDDVDGSDGASDEHALDCCGGCGGEVPAGGSRSLCAACVEAGADFL